MNAEDHPPSLFGLPIILVESNTVIFGDLIYYIKLGVIEVDKRVYLKIKLKSLLEEAKIIRKEQGRAQRSYKWCKVHEDENTADYMFMRIDLERHRRYTVRPEARATLLAYGYLCSKPYEVIEQRSKKLIPFDRIESMVKRYGTAQQFYDFNEWKKSAQQYWDDYCVTLKS